MSTTGAFCPEEYNAKINATIPFYSEFHKSIVDLLKAYMPHPKSWLDTGCGTGNLYAYAREQFPDTEFILADPSRDMLRTAREQAGESGRVHCILSDSQSLHLENESVDVITAVQSHHYLSGEERRKATENCHRMLKKEGVYITFENYLPDSEEGIQLALKRWKNYQIAHGKTLEEAQSHIERFHTEYFPITVQEHIQLLRDAGFRTAEILWLSYMQAGLYAIK